MTPIPIEEDTPRRRHVATVHFPGHHFSGARGSYGNFAQGSGRQSGGRQVARSGIPGPPATKRTETTRYRKIVGALTEAVGGLQGKSSAGCPCAGGGGAKTVDADVQSLVKQIDGFGQSIGAIVRTGPRACTFERLWNQQPQCWSRFQSRPFTRPP